MAITKRVSKRDCRKKTSKKTSFCKKRRSAAKRASKKRVSKKTSGKKRVSKRVSKKTSKKVSRKTPGTPAQPAMKFPEGTKRQGRNGHMYKTVASANGTKLAWKKCNGKSVICPTASVQGPQRY